MEKIIVYIVSDVRSGSTLLENIISRENDVFPVGELHSLGSYLRREGWGAEWQWRCSCGEEIEKCSFWKLVLLDFDSPFCELGINTEICDIGAGADDDKVIENLESIY